MISSNHGNLQERIFSLIKNGFFHGIDRKKRNFFLQKLDRWLKCISFDNLPWPKTASYSLDVLSDKVSLVVTPLVSSIGICVLKNYPSWPGRPEGLTDILRSIPGFRTTLRPREIEKQVSLVKGALFSVPEWVNPRLSLLEDYPDGLSFSLIASLLLSDLSSAAFDIALNDGTSVKDPQEGRELAGLLHKLCNQLKINTSFILRNGNLPLGRAVGSTLELEEVLEVLQGRGPLDILKIALELSTEMLLMTQKFSDRNVAKNTLKSNLLNGCALQRFGKIIEAQKGDPHIIDDYSILPKARKKVKIYSSRNGFLHSFKMRRLVSLREKLASCSSQASSNSVGRGCGILILKKVGDEVRKGEALAEVYCNHARDTSWMSTYAQEIFQISEKPSCFRPLIIERIR